jgi:hypothetical protein
MHMSEHSERQQVGSRPIYRTPSQIHRDNGRMQQHMFYRSAQPFDSGIQMSTPREGPSRNSMDAVNHNIGKKSMYGNSSGLFSDIHLQYSNVEENNKTDAHGRSELMQDLNESRDNSSAHQLVDAEVQCGDRVDMADADTSVEVVDVTNEGVQCEEFKVDLTECGIQCGDLKPDLVDIAVQYDKQTTDVAAANSTRDVGITCYVKANSQSRQVQTKPPNVSNASVSCTKSMKGRGMQTESPRNIWNTLRHSVECQTSPQTVGRHTQVSPSTCTAKTQTLNEKPLTFTIGQHSMAADITQWAQHVNSPVSVQESSTPSEMMLAESVADGSVTASYHDQYLDQVGASLTDQAGHSVPIKNTERSRKLHGY